MKDIVNKLVGTTSIKSALNNLFRTVQSIWNMGKLYHSCDISEGVAKGLAGYQSLIVLELLKVQYKQEEKYIHY